MPCSFGSFFHTLEFEFKARGLWDLWHQWLILQKYLEDKERTFKINLTVSLILRFNLRLEGYSIWSVIFHRTTYKRLFLKT
jgi:hypothetical protein